MGIQNDFNNSLMGMAAIASISNLNNTIAKLGFKNEDELNAAINTLKIQIADCKNKNINCENKEELLNEYIAVKNAHEEQVRKDQKEKQDATIVAIGLIGIVLFIGLAIAISIFE